MCVYINFVYVYVHLGLCVCAFTFSSMYVCWNIILSVYPHVQTVCHSVNLEIATQLLEIVSVLLAIVERTAA